MSPPPPRRVLIVDDEAPARRRLKRLLAAHPEIEVVGEAEDAEEAAEAIDVLRPDLVFLDIRMPAGTGFDALARAEHQPLVVFVTAYDQYALKAFEADSLDYLLKPVNEEVLSRCLQKLARLNPATTPAQPALQSAIEKALRAATSPPPRLAARQGGRVVFLEPSSIVFFRAQDKYTIARTNEGKEYVLEESLKYLEENSAPVSFIRVHRNALVNAAFVGELQSVLGGRYRVKLSDPSGTVLRTSRAGARAIREALLKR